MNYRFEQIIKDALLRGAELELATPRMVAGISGRRLGRHTGNALEFAEYREYQVGDDLRRLDWGVYARNEQLMIKLYSEEVDPRCDIILDHSASMATGEGLKAATAFGLAALFSKAATNAGFSFAVWHSAEKLIREVSPGHPFEWIERNFDHSSNPDEVLTNSPACFQRQGIRIVITDLYWSTPPENFLRRLADGAMQVILIELVTQEELNPTDRGNWALCDPETGTESELYLDDAIINRYRNRLSRHREMWSKSAEEFGIRLIPLTVEDFLKDWNLKEFFRCGVLK